ncbi:MAG: hypothetical protein BGP04_07385 [Rhizobiales bacterium 62-17]|nr:alpha/beta fold hydrolase [Hyphomicrobiales bacterium]OJY05230.1 MAG: hypothetical protein BGP04_07385 [Rhizobiales bacterium 62-17]
METTHEDGWAEVNGVTLRFTREGEGPALLLIHEIGGSLESWDAIVPALARDFHVLRYDQRGAGRSEKVRQPFSLNELVDDLEALVDQLLPSQGLHVMGAAMGAAQAVMLAGRRRTQIASLALLSPALEVDPQRADLMRARARQTDTQGLRATLPLTLDRAWPPDDGQARALYRARYLSNDPYGFARHNEALLDLDIEDTLRALSCPVLLVAGQRDRVRPPEMARRAAALLARPCLAEIDAAHFMAAEKPAAVLEQVTTFYRTLVPSHRDEGK